MTPAVPVTRRRRDTAGDGMRAEFEALAGRRLYLQRLELSRDRATVAGVMSRGRNVFASAAGGASGLQAEGQAGEAPRIPDWKTNTLNRELP